MMVHEYYNSNSKHFPNLVSSKRRIHAHVPFLHSHRWSIYSKKISVSFTFKNSAKMAKMINPIRNWT